MNNIRSKTWATQEGFTLLEIVVVLVVLGVVVGIAMVAGLDTTSASVVAEADILRAHLGFVQSLAMANNTADWSILFSSGFYSLRRDGLASPVNFPGESSTTHQLMAGVNIVGGLGTLDFDQWGAPAATYTVAFSDGSHQEQVSITGGTGLVP